MSKNSFEALFFTAKGRCRRLCKPSNNATTPTTLLHYTAAHGYCKTQTHMHYRFYLSKRTLKALYTPHTVPLYLLVLCVCMARATATPLIELMSLISAVTFSLDNINILISN